MSAYTTYPIFLVGTTWVYFVNLCQHPRPLCTISVDNCPSRQKRPVRALISLHASSVVQVCNSIPICIFCLISAGSRIHTYFAPRFAKQNVFFSSIVGRPIPPRHIDQTLAIRIHSICTTINLLRRILLRIIRPNIHL